MHDGSRLVIACTRPGLIRGGVRHPKSASYQLDFFAEPALREMLAEPELVLALGVPLTTEMLPLAAAPEKSVDEPTPPATPGRPRGGRAR